MVEKKINIVSLTRAAYLLLSNAVGMIRYYVKKFSFFDK
jgi:hypothetical protein